ncbi:MAG: DMT family transporter [Candidatus Neomarinimicrobiota bacterium]
MKNGIYSEKEKNQRLAYFYTSLVVLFWSTVATAFKFSLKYLDVYQLLFFASLSSTVILFVVAICQKKVSNLRRLTRNDFIRSALLGLLNPTIYYLVLFKAYALLPAQIAQPLNYTWPIVLVLLSVPFLKQPLSWKSIVPICLSFLGVVVLSTGGRFAGIQPPNATGVYLAVGSSVIWASYWLMNMKDSCDKTLRLLLNFSFGTIYSLGAVFCFSQIGFPGWKALAGTAYIGAFEMGFTFILWLKALNLSETTAKISNYIFLSPFISLVFIHFLVGETIQSTSVMGLVLIVSGILFQNRLSR